MTSSDPITWSKITRFIHWSIAIIVILNIFVIDDGELPHRYLGYAAVALVIARFIYGCTTKTESALLKLPLSWRALKEFIYAKFRFQRKEYPGHNPAASWVYILIWMSLIFLGISGFMMGLDRFWGDETIEEVHELFSDGLQILIVIHFIGIGLDSIQYKQKTWLGMITGKKAKGKT